MPRSRKINLEKVQASLDKTCPKWCYTITSDLGPSGGILSGLMSEMRGGREITNRDILSLSVGGRGAGRCAVGQ